MARNYYHLPDYRIPGDPDGTCRRVDLYYEPDGRPCGANLWVRLVRWRAGGDVNRPCWERDYMRWLLIPAHKLRPNTLLEMGRRMRSNADAIQELLDLRMGRYFYRDPRSRRFEADLVNLIVPEEYLPDLFGPLAERIAKAPAAA